MAGSISLPFSFPNDWRVESARQIADTVVGTLFEVTRVGGEFNVVKVLKPKAFEDSLRGADFMEWRDGIGCIRLIDRSENALLMEHAGKVTLRDHMETHGDVEATRIAAEVLREYHRPSDIAPPSSLQPLTRYFASLFRKARKIAATTLPG